MTALLICADYGFFAAAPPRVRYLGEGGWGRYDQATVFADRAHAKAAADAAAAAFTGTDTAPRVEVIAQYPVDLDGYPMTGSCIGALRLTHCCAAATSTVTGPLYCKSCYREVPWDYEGPARTSADPAAREHGLIGPIAVRVDE